MVRRQGRRRGRSRCRSRDDNYGVSEDATTRVTTLCSTFLIGERADEGAATDKKRETQLATQPDLSALGGRRLWQSSRPVVSAL